MGGPWGELEPVDPWPCEAYGPGKIGLEVGAMCFVSELGERSCASAEDCHAVMAGCRDRLGARIAELADRDPFWAELAADLGDPGALLGGESVESAEPVAEPSTVRPVFEIELGPRYCGCPADRRTIRHDRATCADPLVIKMGWFGT